MLKNYVKTAFKVFLRRKFFTFISLFAISFTLTVLMVATALLDHLFGPLPPETKIDRTLGLFYLEKTGPHSMSAGHPDYIFQERYVRTLPDVERVSLFSYHNLVIDYQNGLKIEIGTYLKHTDSEFWKILEFDFLEGSPFTAQDEKDGNLVAVINEATRKRHFGDQPALGKTIEVDRQKFRVVGVVANISILRTVPFSDIWVPISTAKSKQTMSAMALILARSRSDFNLIRQEFQSRLPQVEFPDRQYNKISGEVETCYEATARRLNLPFLRDVKRVSIERFFGTILGAMLLFMLLPTLNLINLNVSRILERASEIGVRKAFGASSRTLTGQFVVENVLLTLIGGLLGFIGSFLALQAITHSGLFQYARFSMNYRIFLYGLLISIFFGIFSGVYPAWRMSQLHPSEALRRRPT